MSVTEQMVIHAQDFNVRINQIEQLAITNHKVLSQILIELVDKIDVLEIHLKELHAHEMA